MVINMKYILSKHSRKLVENTLDIPYRILMKLSYEEIINMVNEQIKEKYVRIYIDNIFMDKNKNITKKDIDKILVKERRK